MSRLWIIAVYVLIAWDGIAMRGKLNRIQRRLAEIDYTVRAANGFPGDRFTFIRCATSTDLASQSLKIDFAYNYQEGASMTNEPIAGRTMLLRSADLCWYEILSKPTREAVNK